MSDMNTYRLELDEYRHPVLVAEGKTAFENGLIGTPQDAVEMAKEIFHLDRMAEENAVMITVDAKGHPLGAFAVSHGTVNTANCGAREIFIRALIVGASGVFILHNHPSGISSPSDSDESVAKRLKEAGQIIGIEMVDFIIVGADEYYSFRESDIIPQSS
jgi:DNA repair protein RadC